MKKNLLKPLVLSCMLVPALAQAGGIYLYEVATADNSLASAGTAARAEDASTIYANPAGMTRLNGNQMSLGGQAMHVDANYELNDPNRAGPGNVVGWLPSASAFYSHSINDRLKVGIGAYGNFGMALDFGSDWAGHNAVTDATLQALTIQPTAAYKLNDHWSVGLGITANYGMMALERDPLLSGGHIKTDDSDWAYGARLGLMYELNDATRFGLVWGSEVQYDFDVDTNFPNLIPGLIPPTLGAEVNAPQSLMLSGYHQINPRWAVMGNLGWQDWSRFAESTVQNNKSSLNLQDTWHAALGAQYTLNPKIKLNGGIAYDSSFYESQDETSFLLPAGATWRFGTGVQYSLNEISDINFAIEYALTDGIESEAGPLSGSYDKTDIWVMSVQYSRSF